LKRIPSPRLVNSSIWLDLVYENSFFAGFRNASLTFQHDILMVLQQKRASKLTRACGVVLNVVKLGRSHWCRAYAM